MHRLRGADGAGALPGFGGNGPILSATGLLQRKPLSASNRIEQPLATLVQFFDYSTKINGSVCEPPVLGDFGLIQNAKSVALEKFESPSAVESDNLRVDLFDSVIAEKSKVGFQKSPTHSNGAYLGQ